MSQLTQMAGLAVQNFASAAVGISVAVALMRGLANKSGDGLIGNFWVDVTRTIFRILLPVAAVVAVLLLTQGVIQNFAAPHTVETFTGVVRLFPGVRWRRRKLLKNWG